MVYSIDAKCDFLGLARDLVERCGAVSREVAVAIAQGALAGSRGDIALSIGRPGDGAGDEASLVHFGCARNRAIGYPVTHREEHFGDIGRGPTRIACMGVALEMIDAAIKQEDPD